MKNVHLFSRREEACFSCNKYQSLSKLFIKSVTGNCKRLSECIRKSKGLISLKNYAVFWENDKIIKLPLNVLTEFSDKNIISLKDYSNLAPRV